jgi:hypothetical protein
MSTKAKPKTRGLNGEQILSTVQVEIEILVCPAISSSSSMSQGKLSAEVYCMGR